MISTAHGNSISHSRDGGGRITDSAVNDGVGTNAGEPSRIAANDPRVLAGREPPPGGRGNTPENPNDQHAEPPHQEGPVIPPYQANVADVPQQAGAEHHPLPQEEGQRTASGNQKKRKRKTRKRTGKKTYANVKVGSLNMRGHSVDALGNPDNKWTHMNSLLRNEKLGILAIQETHLTDRRLQAVQQAYGHKLHIINSANITRPNAHGVGIIINKEIVPADDVAHWDIVPGRALLVKLRWHRDHHLGILAVYAPNDPTQNGAFWGEVRDFIEENGLTKPDIVLGDFNLVEDPVDRLPCRLDPAPAVEQLSSALREFEVTDGWRAAHPDQ